MTLDQCKPLQTVQISNPNDFYYTEIGRIVQINPTASFVQSPVVVEFPNRNNCWVAFQADELRLIAS